MRKCRSNHTKGRVGVYQIKTENHIEEEASQAQPSDSLASLLHSFLLKCRALFFVPFLVPPFRSVPYPSFRSNSRPHNTPILISLAHTSCLYRLTVDAVRSSKVVWTVSKRFSFQLALR
jgi:hypothetical protein